MSEERVRPMGERLASVETWISQHEKRCGDRYRLLTGALAVIFSIIIGCSGWAFSHVFDAQQRQLDLLQQVNARVAYQPPPGSGAAVAQHP